MRHILGISAYYHDAAAALIREGKSWPPPRRNAFPGQGHRVSSVHLRFVSPLEPGLKEIFQGFRRVMRVEINYSDSPTAPLVTPETRRYAQLAFLLRAHTRLDIDCWSVVLGHPLQPGMIHRVLVERIEALGQGGTH